MIFQDLIDQMKPDDGQVWRICRGSMAKDASGEALKMARSGEKAEGLSDTLVDIKITTCLIEMHRGNFHPFLLPINQAIEFMYSKIDTEDVLAMFRLKMPFEKIFIDFNGTLRLDGENIKGVVITRGKMGELDTEKAFNNDHLPEGVKNFAQTTNELMVWAITDKFMQEAWDRYPYCKTQQDGALGVYPDFNDKIEALLSTIDHKCPCVFVAECEDEPYMHSRHDQDQKEVQEFSETIRKIAIGFCLYVNSINVDVVKVEGKQTKKRNKQGKGIPEPYYMCKLETKEVHVSDEQRDGAKHSFQYDVRGHFKHFKKGKMKGRTLWCPPHRRGLGADVYRPKTYDLCTA